MPKTMKHKCEVCNKAFSTKCEFTRHMQSHTTERPHRCDVCRKKFKQKHHLTEHKRIHSDVRPFICPDCGKAFVQSSTLRHHKQTHKRESSHVCPNCNKTFVRKSTLKNHTQNFHLELTTAVTTESHEEPAGRVTTTTTHSFSTDSSTINVSYIQPPNTETSEPVQVVTQLTGPIETITVIQSSETISDSQSVHDFDIFQEEIARGLPDLE